MWEFSETTYPVARKKYNCMAWEYLETDDLESFTEEEQEIFNKAREEGFKILKGTQYIRISGKVDGEFCVFRARLDLHKICIDNDVYQD